MTGTVIAASLSDPDRFTEIFERHFDAIYAFTARRLGRELADDVGATVFVEAFAARTRFERDRVDARPWLYGIATNVIHRHRRTEGRRLRAYARSQPPSDGEPVDLERRLDAAALGPQLATALHALGAERPGRVVALRVGRALVRRHRDRDRRPRRHGPVPHPSRARHRLRAELGVDDPVGSLE